jgi:hypothetical protein
LRTTLLVVCCAVATAANCDRTSQVGDPPRAERRDEPRDAGRASAGWAVSAGGAGRDAVWSLALDEAGNLVVAGDIGQSASFGPFDVTLRSKTSGLFVAKLAPDGTFIWVTPLAAVSLDATGFLSLLPRHRGGLTVDAAGNTYVSGAFVGTSTFGGTTLTANADTDGLVVKLDPRGDVLWARNVASGPGADEVSGVAVSPDGSISVAGRFAGTTSVGGVTLGTKAKTGLFVARLDDGGNACWAVRAEGDDPDPPLDADVSSVAVDADGNTVAALSVGPNTTVGSLLVPGQPGNTTSAVAKLGPDGKVAWVSTPPGMAAGPLAIDTGGNIYVGTMYIVRGQSDRASCATLSRLDPAGNLAWHISILGESEIRSVLLESDGELSIGGWFQGPVAFGDIPLDVRDDNFPRATAGFVARVASGAFRRAEPIYGCTYLGLEVRGLARSNRGHLYLAGEYFANSTSALTLGGTVLPFHSGAPDIFIWNRGPDENK